MRSKELYIWQCEEWWKFAWDSSALLMPLAQARKAQGLLLAKADALGLKEEADFFVEEAYQTSQIEGERLQREDIRSSVADRLGLSTDSQRNRHQASEGLVSLLLDIVQSFDRPLTTERLNHWHAGLFPSGRSGIKPIMVGAYRQSTTPMEVISGPMGREKVHYRAPPSSEVPQLMEQFLAWFQSSRHTHDGLVRAALAHFWFVTIHPYDDGNGRLARAICDLALAQDEASSRRLYSLSTQIMKRRKSYYQILEACQTTKEAITTWLLWFLETFAATLADSKKLISRAEAVARYYQRLAEISLNARQSKVLRKLLEVYPEEFKGGLSNRNYVAITGVSPETAKRDLRDLVEHGLLTRGSAAGRSVTYQLNSELLK